MMDVSTAYAPTREYHVSNYGAHDDSKRDVTRCIEMNMIEKVER